MSSELEISVSSMQGKAPVTILRIKGQIDASNVGELEDKATDLIKAGVENVLLDLGQLSFMSSAGFRAIHKIYQALHPEGGSGNLKILNADDHIHRLVKTLGFDKFVALIDGDLQDAVNSF